MNRRALSGQIVVFVAALGIAAAGPAKAVDTEAPGFRVEPGADLGAYRLVQVLEPSVEFRRGWLRDQNRNSLHRVTTADVDRLARELAALFQTVFVEELGGEGGFEIVEGAGPGVLQLRPAIVELDIAAPDLPGNGPSRTYTDSDGAATLVLELVDSASGERVARYVDRTVSRHPADELRWSNGATNRAAQRRMIAGWARQLQKELAALRGE